MKKNIALMLGLLSLAGFPMPSQADYCADIKEQYWNCVRASMTNQSCESNVSIPPECLGSTASKEGQSNNSSESRSSFFGTKKDSKPFVYQSDLPPKKPVKIVNIKPDGKIYLETEEDVDQYLTKIKDEISAAIADGKRVRLQLQ
jgi:hypothetical protein